MGSKRSKLHILFVKLSKIGSACELLENVSTTISLHFLKYRRYTRFFGID